MNPMAKWMAVLFPAPFGPRKPNISPRSTASEKSSSARIRLLPVHDRYSFMIRSYSSTGGISF